MKAEITTITPEHAAKLLRGNTNNRKMRRSLVERYARDMGEGRWIPNGEAVVVNGRTLIDGQHRLQACIESGAPFQTVFVSGVSLDAVSTIDTGAGRTFSDVLKMHGVADHNSIAGIVRFGWGWDQGNLYRTLNPSTLELSEWLDMNPEVHEALAIVGPARNNPLRAKASSLACVVLKSIQNGHREDAVAFIDQMISGANLSEYDAVFHLRNLFINQATSHKKLSRVDIHARIIKAWNYYILGEECGKLIWKNRGARKYREAFPAMVDGNGAAISHIFSDDRD